MRIAGGFIAILAGLLGSCDQLTLPFIGFLFSFGYPGSKTTLVDWLPLFFHEGYPGILFSILVITLGVIAIFVKSKIPGILLILISITYPILGSIISGLDIYIRIFSIISCVLGVIAGILIIIGANSKETPQVRSETEQVVQDDKP